MNISPSIQRFFGRNLLQLQKHSPVILTTVGVVGVVVAGVMAARNTLKLDDRLQDAEDRISWTKQSIKNGDSPQKDLTKAYLTNVYEVGKLYAAPVTLGAASLVCIISAQGILSKRNVALAAAYKGLETTFSAYRERVREEHGEEADRDYYHNIRKEEITDEKTGKKKQVKVLGPRNSEYVFSFGPENQNWTGFHDHNLFFVTAQQNYHNELLVARGHVFLSEILDSLGIARTPASIVTGWVYDPNGGEGDNYIDFGIKDLEEEHGYILLDFNVDGTIFDKI